MNRFDWFPSGPQLFFTLRNNDRPSGATQATIPIQFLMRSDFVAGFDDALETIHATGCQLPILSLAHYLPPVTSGNQHDIDMLYFIGRTIDLVPSLALNDPDMDPIAVARLTPSTQL